MRQFIFLSRNISHKQDTYVMESNKNDTHLLSKSRDNL